MAPSKGPQPWALQGVEILASELVPAAPAPPMTPSKSPSKKAQPPLLQPVGPKRLLSAHDNVFLCVGWFACAAVYEQNLHTCLLREALAVATSPMPFLAGRLVKSEVSSCFDCLSACLGAFLSVWRELSTRSRVGGWRSCGLPPVANHKIAGRRALLRSHHRRHRHPLAALFSRRTAALELMKTTAGSASWLRPRRPRWPRSGPRWRPTFRERVRPCW